MAKTGVVPIPGDPIALGPETYARHASAVDAVEGWLTNRAARPDRNRFPGAAPGAWGLLASGGTITARSGTTLGTGLVKLCDRTGTVYPEDETVDVSNAGAAIAAGGADRIVAMTWVLGEWCAACSGGG